MASAYAARVDLLDAVYTAVTLVVTDLDDDGFTRRTRTAAWDVRALLFHQLCDAQRALIVLTTDAPGPADTDRVSYWAAWSPGTPGADAHARYATRAAAAYGRPTSLVQQWRDTASAAVRAASNHAGQGFVTTQGHVLEVGDFAHTLVVEAVVHHLDLTLEVPSPPLPPEAYAAVVEVLTGLLDADLPAGWTGREAVLKGTGRDPLDAADRAAFGDRAARFPLFGLGQPRSRAKIRSREPWLISGRRASARRGRRRAVVTRDTSTPPTAQPTSTRHAPTTLP